MDGPLGPPWFFWLFVAFIASVGFGIFLMAIIRACQVCCSDQPKPHVNQTRRGRYVTNRTSDMENGWSPGFDAPPSYDDVMFSGEGNSWGGGDSGGCDTGGGHSGGGSHTGGGHSGGGCDTGGGHSGGGYYTGDGHSGGGCDTGGGDSGGGCDSGEGGGVD